MFVVWLTGISGAGKTTIAYELKRRMKQALPDAPVELIDGDEVREFFGNDLGYTRNDRIRHIKRIVFAAKLLQRNGVITIVANIAPYYEIRDFARKQIARYVQVYVRCPIEEVERRDVKGHYARIKAGQMTNFIGQDDVYEVPRNPNLVVDTDRETVAESVGKIMSYLESNGYLAKKQAGT